MILIFGMGMKLVMMAASIALRRLNARSACVRGKHMSSAHPKYVYTCLVQVPYSHSS